MKHLDRKRAEGFGLRADRYDRTRPSYADEFIKWLSSEGIGKALDVGTGTGIVARLLTKAGWEVVGLEPDPRMAAKAKSHGVEVIESTFEQWSPDIHDFDLITAGTSWHWVDPNIGYDRAAEVLKPGGKLAIFRNFYHYDTAVSKIIVDTLTSLAPALLKECVPLGISDPQRTDSHVAQLEVRSDLFSDLETRTFRHERSMTINDWIDELTTHSPIYQLEKSVSDKLLGSLASGVRAMVGDHIQVYHDTRCLLAKRYGK